jgi:hypothetical protein
MDVSLCALVPKIKAKTKSSIKKSFLFMVKWFCVYTNVDILFDISIETVINICFTNNNPVTSNLWDLFSGIAFFDLRLNLAGSFCSVFVL